MVLIWRILAATPRPVWWVFAVLAILGTTYAIGGRDSARATAAQEREEYHETLDKIDRTLGYRGGADTARERLRDTLGPWPGDM